MNEDSIPQLDLLQGVQMTLWSVDRQNIEPVIAKKYIEQQCGKDLANFWYSFPPTGWWKVQSAHDMNCIQLQQAGWMRNWNIDLSFPKTLALKRKRKISRTSVGQRSESKRLACA